MKKNLTRFVGSFMLLIATACGKTGTDPEPEPPTPEPEPEPTPVVAENLSKAGTANCYVITKEGEYSLDATVKGNGATTEGLSAPEKLSPASAELLWETAKGMITEVAFADGKITFKVAAQNGNAVIAAKAADGTIIWSWHIWFPEDEISTAETKTGYEVMNMNLGAMTAAFSATPDVRPYGLLYQWGRKDPFPAAPTLTGDVNTIGATLYGPEGAEVKIINSPWGSVADNTIAYAIANPTECLSNYAQYSSSRDWLNPTDSTGSLWGNPLGYVRNSDNKYVNKGAKSFYDPCPVGYRVPPADVFRTFTTSGGYSQDPSTFDVVDVNADGVIDVEDYNYGWLFNMKSGSQFFPAAARYDGSYAMLMGSKSGLWGSYWGNCPAKAYGSAFGMAFCVLSFMNEAAGVSASATASAGRADAYSVRCIKE